MIKNQWINSNQKTRSIYVKNLLENGRTAIGPPKIGIFGIYSIIFILSPGKIISNTEHAIQNVGMSIYQTENKKARSVEQAFSIIRVIAYSATTSKSISMVLPLPKSIEALCIPSSFTSSMIEIRLRSIS